MIFPPKACTFSLRYINGAMLKLCRKFAVSDATGAVLEELQTLDDTRNLDCGAIQERKDSMNITGVCVWFKGSALWSQVLFLNIEFYFYEFIQLACQLWEEELGDNSFQCTNVMHPNCLSYPEKVPASGLKTYCC